MGSRPVAACSRSQATVMLASLDTVVASIEAANFDIAPIVAFAPGALGAARGTLDAALTIKGLDPQRGDVRGKLHLKEGRMPLSPELGTCARPTSTSRS